MSKFFAKLLLRLFILLLLFSLAPFFIQHGLDARLQHIYISLPNKWALIFPVLLFLAFLTLLIITLRTKYKYTDLNWMFVLNTLILVIYLVLVYVRLLPIIFH